MKELDIQTILNSSIRYCNDNIGDLCREILQWHDTGILKDGKVRKLAHMLSYVPAYDRLKVAESMISTLAMESIIHNELIDRMKSLLQNVVYSSESSHIFCNDVDGKIWFDERQKVFDELNKR